MGYIKWLPGIILLLGISSCGALEKCPNGDVCDIQFYNQSQHHLTVVTSDKLPDTSISDIKTNITQIKASEHSQITSTGWRNVINKFCPSGKIMIVLLDIDTINKYGFSDVVANYRIVKRYELSIDSLEKRGWTIRYTD